MPREAKFQGASIPEAEYKVRSTEEFIATSTIFLSSNYTQIPLSDDGPKSQQLRQSSEYTEFVKPELFMLIPVVLSVLSSRNNCQR